MNHGYFIKNVKRKKRKNVKRFAYLWVFLQKEYQKMSTIRRLSGVYGGTEAESSTGKSSQIAFVIGGMTTMSVNSGGIWKK